MQSTTLPPVKRAPEIVSLPVLWTGWMRDPGHPYATVRVLRDDDGKLTVITDEDEVLIGVDRELVHQHFSPDDDAPTRAPKCRDCGHFFDPSDPRGFVAKPSERFPDLGHVCPACNQMQDGAEGWALWNSCQGVFTNDVFHFQNEALDVAKKANGEQAEPIFEAVVPVRVLVEPADSYRQRIELKKGGPL